MDYSLNGIEDLFFNIKCLIEYYENNNIQHNKYVLYLSNGDKLQYNFPKNNFAHLIGINTSYLQSTGIFKSKNSFELIKEMCDNPYRIHKLHNDKIINCDTIFSKYTGDKMMNFAENIKLNVFETEFVCKYNPTASYMISEKTQKYDYIIIKKYLNNSIGFLGLVQNGDYYVPMSNQTFDNYEIAKNEIKDMITNQEITLLSSINYFNNYNGYNGNYYLTIENKIKKINNISDLKNEFNCIIDVSKEFVYLGNKVEQSKYNNTTLINKIIEAIENGTFIDINEDEIDSKNELFEIIESYNNFIYKNNSGKNKLAKKSYSEIIKELNNLKTEVKKLQDENNELITTNETLKHENERMQIENRMLQDTQNKVYELVKPRN